MAHSILKRFDLLAMALGLLIVPAAHADVGDMLGTPFLHAFADAGWGQASKGQPARLYDKGFFLGTLDLYIDPDLGNRVHFLSEVAIDPDWTSEGVGIDTERLQVGYSFNKYLTGWVGRFHTPLGYWSTAYHHAAELQTSVYRPRFIDFEDKYGVLPVHTTGLWLVGTAAIGDAGGRLGYQAFIGNGNRFQVDGSTSPNARVAVNQSGTAPAAVQQPSDFTNLEMEIAHQSLDSISFGFKANWFFSGSLEGLNIGICGMEDTIQADPNTVNPYFAPSGKVSIPLMRLGNIFAVYEAHGFEIINEVYGFSNTDLSKVNGRNYGSLAAFSQVAYAFDNTYVPYVRGETANLNNSDPFFASQTNGVPYSRGAVGFRYNLNERSALKIEGNHTRLWSNNPTYAGAPTANVYRGSYNEIRTQYAVQF